MGTNFVVQLIKYKDILRSVCDIDKIYIYYLSTVAKAVNKTMSYEYDKRAAIIVALREGKSSIYKRLYF